MESIIIDRDKLAKLLGLPSWEDVDEMNWEMVADAGHYAYKESLAEHAEECERLLEDVSEELDGSEWPAEITTADSVKDGLTADDSAEQAAETAREKAEGEASDELYRSYKNACDTALERYLEHFAMAFVDNGDGTIEITPTETWEKVAHEVVETINGVGYFYFSSVDEFVSTNSCQDAREAVESHLHWLKDYGAVYGDRSPVRIYEGAFR